MRLVKERPVILGVVDACKAVKLPKATYYRFQENNKTPRRRKKLHKRALSPEEEQAILNVLHEPRFMDSSPGQVYTSLLDEGKYLASESVRFILILSTNYLTSTAMTIHQVMQEV